MSTCHPRTWTRSTRTRISRWRCAKSSWSIVVMTRPAKLFDAVAQAVASHELVSLGDEFLALAGQSDEAVVDVGGPPRELGRFEHTGLIEISEPSAFCSRCLHAPVEPAELDGEQLVVGSRTPRRAGLLAGEQELGRDQGGSNLTEYERVEGLGADAALVAVPYLPGDV